MDVNELSVYCYLELFLILLALIIIVCYIIKECLYRNLRSIFYMCHIDYMTHISKNNLFQWSVTYAVQL